ncbi:hypothetical protein Nepgr_008630 [Nepenthes gracilis]|uniref:Uncharacterized protein n=1 Tax=Nepenthes gracilis TaxID=150966 RepID=A0AAD3S9E9_NEPGR|nr:hypothetical protein Nepgr_008630 [Nepenthes gracilis]
MVETEPTMIRPTLSQIPRIAVINAPNCIGIIMMLKLQGCCWYHQTMSLLFCTARLPGMLVILLTRVTVMVGFLFRCRFSGSLEREELKLLSLA